MPINYLLVRHNYCAAERNIHLNIRYIYIYFFRPVHSIPILPPSPLYPQPFHPVHSIPALPPSSFYPNPSTQSILSQPFHPVHSIPTILSLSINPALLMKFNPFYLLSTIRPPFHSVPPNQLL